MLREEAGLVEKRSDAKLQVMATPLSLNFFTADIQAGIGPFLGVFLIPGNFAFVEGLGRKKKTVTAAVPAAPSPEGAH